MEEHSDAFAARLDAHAQLSLGTTLYDAPRKISDPVRQPPYVVFYLYIEGEFPTKLNYLVSDEVRVTVITHAAGGSKEAANLFRKYVRAQLLDWKPTVAGWVFPGAVRHRDGDQPDWDDTTGILLMDAVDTWTYRAHPA